MSEKEGDIFVPTLKLPSTTNSDTDSFRIDQLKNAFKTEYLVEPTFIVRVPGR